MRRHLLSVAALLAPALFIPAAPPPEPGAVDWTTFGGTPARNMVNLTPARLSIDFPKGAVDDPRAHVLGSRVKWKAQLGSRSYPQPIVVGDRVLIGTNNENPRNPRDRARPTADEPNGPPIDRGVLMCFRASDGAFLWQMVHDKRESGQVNDWPREGMCSTPTVEGGRAYYVSNRCEVVCLDLNGLADGNQGFQGEKYQDRTDGDVLWSFDMMKELTVFPHNMSMCSPVIAGDLLFVTTANGVDENHVNVPSPDAPSFLCLSKHSGRLVWKSNLPGKDIMHGQWSSPAYGVIGGRPQVIFPGGDGWLYAFEPETGKLLWKFDCNTKGAKYELGGKGERSDFIAFPVIHRGRVYIGTGQDPDHLDGIAYVWCVDPAGKDGDISPELVTDAAKDPPATQPNPNSGLVWRYGGNETRPFAKRDFIFGRTLSTACVVDDVVYIADLAGYLHVLDARTGKKYWQWDTKSQIWGSCYHVDGKVLVCNEDGDLFIFKHDKNPEVLDESEEGPKAAEEVARRARAAGKDEREVLKAAREARDAAAATVRQKVAATYLLRKVELGETVRSTPTLVGDTLYVGTEKTLYAVRANTRK